MSKTVILYVTRSGHARSLAQDIAGRFATEATEIVDLVDRKGPMGYLKTGAQASSKAATPIKDPGVDLSSASTLILVQPVWAGNLCPPLRTWFQAHKAELAGKRIGFLATNKGSDPDSFKARVEAELGSLAAFALLRESLPKAEVEKALAGFKATLGA